jgi:hypothetical protein
MFLLALVTTGAICASATAADLAVATNGNDSWSGKLTSPNRAKTDGPFATLERARDEIRKMKKAGALPAGGVTVEVRGGVYERQRPFELTAEDAGTADAPIVYRARRGEEVRFVGGKAVTGWKPVTDPAVLSRLDESVRGKVLQADLRALGITNFGQVTTDRLELFFQDKPMTLSRWPNEGFVRIVDVLGKTPVDVRGTKGTVEGVFTYDGDRPKRWTGEKDIWVHGYWFWDWSDQRQKIQSIDIEKRILSVAPPYHTYGYRKGQWFYALNVLAELDAPGEWYLDRETGVLYFYPPAPIERGKAVVSILPTLVTMKETSHVTLRGFTLEAARGTAITMAGGTQNQIVGCTIRNVGSLAVRVDGGTQNAVIGCDIYATGDGGIVLSGGDRKTLTPAGHLAENNHIHDYGRWNRMYTPAMALNGVGNRAAHNLIHDAPHQAMAFSGNDHLIEFNEIHNVCTESNDAGAIYSGRDWTWRGTVIRYNYFHHITGFEGRGCVGVYLDDMLCGTEIYGNVFYQVTRAAFIGGGRDCTIENNIFVDCKPAVHVDARALGWAGYHAQMWIQEGKDKGTLSGTLYDKPPYSTKYPKLPNILNEDAAAPRGNVIARNVCVGGRWDEIEGKARPMIEFKDNLLDEDPHFVDAAKFNFQLRDDSPAYKLGFKRIPIEKIGLYKDDRRASYPVSHPIRAMSAPTPPPPPKRQAGPPPVFNVPKVAATVHVDGAISPEEWNGADPSRAMPIEQGIEGEKASPRSLAWLMHDGMHLFVAIDNLVDPSKPLLKGQTWGQDDAVEIALRNTAAGKNAPIIVLRGYLSGFFESSTEAGASASVARKASEGVKFAAKVVAADRWTAEFQIPFASLGMDPAKHTRFEFNLTVRKTAAPIWLMWRGTGGYSWAVENAGAITLGR